MPTKLSDPPIRTAGDGWQAVGGMKIWVDGHLYEGYQKDVFGHRSDVYIMVLDEELCFYNGTKWPVVVDCIRKVRDLSQLSI